MVNSGLLFERKAVAVLLNRGKRASCEVVLDMVIKSVTSVTQLPSGVQPSIMLEIEEVILSLQAHKEIAILVVEQFLDFALSIADYFYIMETGKIVEQGSIEHFNDEISKTYLAV